MGGIGVEYLWVQIFFVSGFVGSDCFFAGYSLVQDLGL